MMTPIYKLCFALGLLATGGEVATHGADHARAIKKLAAPYLHERAPNHGIEGIPMSDFDQLPSGIQREQH